MTRFFPVAVYFVKEQDVFLVFLRVEGSMQVDKRDAFFRENFLYVAMQTLLSNREIGGPAVKGVLFSQEDLVGPGEARGDECDVQGDIHFVEVDGDIEYDLQGRIDIGAQVWCWGAIGG